MTALSANAEVTRLSDQELREFPVAGSEHIYKGSLVGKNPAGYLKTFEPGDEFMGLSYEEADNSASTTDGAINCRLYVDIDFMFTLTSVAQTDVGKAVYATDDATIALTGHPDAYVGRIWSVESTNLAVIRMRQPGEHAPDDGSCIDIDIDFAKILLADQDEGTATLKVGGSSLKTACVGAGLTAGTTGITVDEATGELELLLDNDNEAQNLTIETPQVFNITKGITFEFEGRNKTAGGAATDDMDYGLMGLSGGITATERANMNATTAGLLSCLFHLDTNALSIYGSSDDNASPVAATDTTVDNSLTVNHKAKIICRVDGSCELWIAGARVLSTTAFSVGASGLLAGIINLEKSTGTGVPEARVRRMRVAGAIA